MPVNRTNTGRDSKGRFVKGNKNGGRPKLAPEFKMRAKEISMPALERLNDIIFNPASEHKDVIAAVKLVFGYAHGMPSQEIRADLSADIVLDFAGDDPDGD